MAEACLKLAFDLDLRMRLGWAGFERVSARYSLDVMIDRTAGVYNDLLRRRGLGENLPAGLGVLL